MNGTIKGLVAIAALAGAVACGDAASPTDALVEPGAALMGRTTNSTTLTFSYTQTWDVAQTQSASGGIGVIDFAGSEMTPSPCYDVTAAHSQRNSTITVTVTGIYNGQPCIQELTNNDYIGQVAGLAPGTYTLTVVHDVGGSRSTAFTGGVTVQ
jgi:hypothetical protein